MAGRDGYDDMGLIRDWGIAWKWLGNIGIGSILGRRSGIALIHFSTFDDGLKLPGVDICMSSGL
jgi:hypothetical protein